MSAMTMNQRVGSSTPSRSDQPFQVRMLRAIAGGIQHDVVARRRQRAVRLPRQPRIAQHRAGLQCHVAGLEAALLCGPLHAVPHACVPHGLPQRSGPAKCHGLEACMIRLIAVGRLRDGPEAALFARYNARLRPPLGVTEVPEARGAAIEIKRREAASLLRGVPGRGVCRGAGSRRRRAGQRAAGRIAATLAGVRARAVLRHRRCRRTGCVPSSRVPTMCCRSAT